MKKNTINRLATMTIALALAGACTKGSPLSPSEPIAAPGILEAGNVGSSPLTLKVNGETIETIAAGNAIEYALSSGVYRVTFETTKGTELGDCDFAELIITSGERTFAYCAE